jgi:excisionase family DNA binding protein
MAVVIPWLYVVYRLYDADGTPLYIGSTKSLASRLDGHRRTKPWWSEVERLETEQFASIDEMREAEQQEIESLNPRYNVKHNRAKGTTTAEEIAARLKVSQHTIDRWIRQRRIRATRKGRDYRVTEAAFSEFIEQRRTGREER